MEKVGVFESYRNNGVYIIIWKRRVVFCVYVRDRLDCLVGHFDCLIAGMTGEIVSPWRYLGVISFSQVH
jgi:hypothetical protein